MKVRAVILRFLGSALLLLAFQSSLPAAENPTRVAREGRFDLSAKGVIEKGTVLSAAGKVARPSWLPAEQQSRSYFCTFPIAEFLHDEIVVRLEPQDSGEVELRLMGPGDNGADEKREEVEWDSVKVEGAQFTNDGFDQLPKPARSGHDAPLRLSLRVQAGAPVVIRAVARPVIPPDQPRMKRILSRETLAHQAARRFLRGTNLGNYLEAPPGQEWGARYAAEDFVFIRGEGFDHVRLPVGWHHFTGPAPDYQLRDEIYTKVDFLVEHALKNSLQVIVDLHLFREFVADPPREKERFLAIWRQIAQHYAAAPSSVAFELLNEPESAATTEVMNPIYAEALRQIRATNPQRTVFVGPGKWNAPSELSALMLPDDDQNLIATVHCYEPFQFTHQGASWAGEDRKLTGIVYPGPPLQPLTTDLQLKPSVREWLEAYNNLATAENPSSARSFQFAIHLAKSWSDYYGRPVHMGEFGAFTKAADESRARYYAEMRRALDGAGIGWATWDWKAGFRYWNPKANQPMPGMREALFAQ